MNFCSGSKKSSSKDASRQGSKKDTPSPSATSQLDELMMSLASFGDEEEVRLEAASEFLFDFLESVIAVNIAYAIEMLNFVVKITVFHTCYFNVELNYSFYI